MKGIHTQTAATGKFAAAGKVAADATIADKIAAGEATTGEFVAGQAGRSTRSYEWGRRAGAAQRSETSWTSTRV